MILAVDVQYVESTGFVAGLAFTDWESASYTHKYFSKVNDVSDYQSGEFYKRELPCILRLLNEHSLRPSAVVIDGYVHLNNQRPGLGQHLFEALDKKAEIIGVAKREFKNISSDHQIIRGKSKKPLFVTSTSNLHIAKKMFLICMVNIGYLTC